MELFHKFCTETSMHGLSHIRRDKPRVLNVLWFFVFLCALSGSLVGIFKVFVLYFSSPMSTDYRIVANDSMELPSLSICALSHLSKTKLRKLGVSSDLEEVIYFALGFNLRRSELLDPNNTKLRREYTDILKKYRLNDFEDLLMMISLSCEEMIGEPNYPGNCTFGEQYLNCCRQMKQYLFPAKCITVAASGFMDPKDAYAYGLNLHWPTTEEKFIPSKIAARSRDYTLLMNKGGMGILGAKEIGRVRPGRMYNIKVWMRMYESVNNPPRYICSEELPYPGYDQTVCMEDCVMSTVFTGMDQCNCTMAGAFKARRIKTQMTNFTNWKELCDPWQLQECQTHVVMEGQRKAAEMKRKSEEIMKETDETKQRALLMELSQEKEGDNVNERCRIRCPKTCKKIVWEAKMLETIHDPEILSDFYEHEQTSLKGTEIDLNSSYVSLGFEEMEYKYTKQQLAMTGETILSYLGGQLGLFLGGSLLTFAHFALFLAYECCYRLCCDTNQKEKQLYKASSGSIRRDSSTKRRNNNDKNLLSPSKTRLLDANNINNNNSGQQKSVSKSLGGSLFFGSIFGGIGGQMSSSSSSAGDRDNQKSAAEAAEQLKRREAIYWDKALSIDVNPTEHSSLFDDNNKDNLGGGHPKSPCVCTCRCYQNGSAAAHQQKL